IAPRASTDSEAFVVPLPGDTDCPDAASETVAIAIIKEILSHRIRSSLQMLLMVRFIRTSQSAQRFAGVPA
ncbi:MAG TPA: hypothetical protein VGI25_01810, partial [Candidatus Udaeobacter sp.]